MKNKGKPCYDFKKVASNLSLFKTFWLCYVSHIMNFYVADQQQNNIFFSKLCQNDTSVDARPPGLDGYKVDVIITAL